MTEPSASGPLARFGREAGTALAGLLSALLGAIGYFFRRVPRGTRGRIGLADLVEGVAIAALVVGLVAAAMVLVDPLAVGLRQKLPLAVVHVFERITALGLGGVVLWPLGLALLAVLAVAPRLDRMGGQVAAAVAARLGFLFFAIAGAGLCVSILKHLLGRARPSMVLVLGGENGQFTFQWLGWKSSFASFPSGHSTTAFAAAMAFAALFPRARVPLLALATLVAVSRIALGSHFPSDVIAGAAFGTAFVLAMVKMFAARRLVFGVDAENRVRPKPGPSARRLGQILPTERPSGRSVSMEEARP